MIDESAPDTVSEAPTDQSDELRRELGEAQERIASLEARLTEQSRAIEIERLLVEAGTVDLETARVLVDRRLAAGDVAPDAAVRALVSAKGYLFRSAQPVASAVSGAPSRAPDELDELAIEARQTGDRRAVLRYLRRRRG